MLIQLTTWLLLWLIAASAGAGIIAAARRWTGLDRAPPPELFGLTWLGLAAIVALLELWSLAGPISGACAAVVVVVAATGAPALAVEVRRGLRRWRRRSVAGAIMIGIWIFIAGALVSMGANQNVGLGDTCSTHIQQVMWARDYGAVRGLGLLNSKLAFDQSAHLFAALLDHGPWRDKSLRVAVPFFLWLVLVQWIVTLMRPSRGDADVRSKVYCAITLPFLLVKTNPEWLEVQSFSGDLAMACVALATGLAMIRLPFARRRVGRALGRRAHDVMVLFAMVALLVTIKLTGAMLFLFGAVVVGVCAAGLPRRWLGCALAIPVALLVGMIARRVVLSGWPLFPMPFGKLPVAWAVPRAETVDQYRWIRSWARLPDHSPDELDRNGVFFWFVPWFEPFRQTGEFFLFLVASGLITARWSSGLWRSQPVAPVEAGVLCSVVLSIVYWFLGAPDLRFGAVFFWMLAAVAAMPILSARYLWSPTPRAILVGVACALLWWKCADWLPRLRGAPGWLTVPAPGVSYPMKRVEIPDPRGPALQLNVPTGRAYCGDAPLPCTPFPRNQRLRRPGDLRAGFTL